MVHRIPTSLNPITTTHPTKIICTPSAAHVIAPIILLDRHLTLRALLSRLHYHCSSQFLIPLSYLPVHSVLVRRTSFALVPRRLVRDALAEVAHDASEDGVVGEVQLAGWAGGGETPVEGGVAREGGDEGKMVISVKG
jgi:hypothetical protein